MDTLRSAAKNFSRIAVISDDARTLEAKPQSRLKSVIYRVPTLNVGEFSILALELGSVVNIRSVKSINFNISVEFHSTEACEDEDATIFENATPGIETGSFYDVAPVSGSKYTTVINRDEIESPIIYTKITNNGNSQQSILLKIDYFELSESVFRLIYPKFSISSSLSNLIIPKIKTPINTLEFSSVFNEFSVDSIPNLVDLTHYSRYESISTTNANNSYLVARSKVASVFTRTVAFSRNFQLEGEYKIYFDVASVDDIRYSELGQVIPTDSTNETSIVFNYKDRDYQFSHSLTIDTSLSSRGKLASQMLVFSIKNNLIESAPVVMESDIVTQGA